MNLILFENDEVEKPLDRNDSRAQHILEILKLTEGDRLAAGVVGGRWGSLRLESIGEKALVFSDPQWDKEAALPLPLHLLVGTPRPPTARRLLKDMTTLGVSSLTFSATELGEKSYLQSTLWKGDWHLACREGAMQARTTHLPQVHRTERLGLALARFRQPEFDDALKLFFDEGGESVSRLDGPPPKQVILALGPERGFTPEERQRLVKDGWRACRLGSRTLRTETACAAGVVLCAERWFWPK